MPRITPALLPFRVLLRILQVTSNLLRQGMQEKPGLDSATAQGSQSLFALRLYPHPYTVLRAPKSDSKVLQIEYCIPPNARMLKP